MLGILTRSMSVNWARYFEKAIFCRSINVSTEYGARFIKMDEGLKQKFIELIREMSV